MAPCETFGFKRLLAHPPHSNSSIFNLEFELIVVKEVFEGKVSIEFHSELCAFHGHFLREAGFYQYHIPLKTAFFVVGPHNIDTFMFFGSVNSLPLKATRIFQKSFCIWMSQTSFF